MGDFTVDEKMQLVEVALKYIAPIMIKHGIENEERFRTALIESFQAGIKFYHETAHPNTPHPKGEI